MKKQIKVPRQYNIYTSQDKKLKLMAKNLKVSVSEIVRNVLEVYLNDPRKDWEKFRDICS